MKLIDLNDNMLHSSGLKCQKLTVLGKSNKMGRLEKLGKMEKLYGKGKWSKNDREINYDIEIYAELSKKQYSLIQSGEYEIEIPHGVSMHNRTGSRALCFSCSDIESAQELVEGLEVSNISWQENFDGVELLK